MTSNLRRLTPDDLSSLRQFWNEQWSGEFIVTHGSVHRPEEVEGFVIDEDGAWAGLVTYKIVDNECEILSLDGLREGEGIGTMLLRNVIEEAKQRNCRRIFLVTTNDNLYALGFYQRRDFEIVAVHRGALDETRKIKPEIPIIGENHIPLRDEIELELIL